MFVNNGKNHLHGGLNGFHKKIWSCTEYDNVHVALKYLSRDMEEGYPGNLDVRVTYRLTNDNALEIHYSAVSDQDTLVNLTNHSYFNLSGKADKNILNHELQLFAGCYTPINEELIPTGEKEAVKQTPFDFTQPKAIGKEIGTDDPQIRFANGYDHNFILKGNGLKKAAEVYEPSSGRLMEVFTTKPAIQLYTGNFLNSYKGKNDCNYDFRSGFCLETQFSPDSPNQKGFDDVILKAGQNYVHQTVYKFSVGRNEHV